MFASVNTLCFQLRVIFRRSRRWARGARRRSRRMDSPREFERAKWKWPMLNYRFDLWPLVKMDSRKEFQLAQLIVIGTLSWYAKPLIFLCEFESAFSSFTVRSNARCLWRIQFQPAFWFLNIPNNWNWLLQVLSFLREHVVKDKSPLAGNTIYMDRIFIKKWVEL